MIRTKIFTLLLASGLFCTLLVPQYALAKSPAASQTIQVGYTTDTITKPAAIAKTKQDVLNAINDHVQAMDTSFTIQIENFSANKLPQKSEEIEFFFVEEIDFVKKGTKNRITTLQYNVRYNAAGQLVQNHRFNTKLPNDKTVQAFKKVCDGILKEAHGKTDAEKAIAFHDYLVTHVDYRISESETRTTAYDALIKGEATSDGYAEAYQLLLTLSDIPNRVVYSVSNFDSAHPHYFNKVQLGDDWYNVDVSVDDPNRADGKNPIVRTYLLVSDAIVQQRYTWETTRYPAATKTDNWHVRNKQTAKNQADLEKQVKQAIADKKEVLSIWVDDYNPKDKNYDFAFLKKSPDLASHRVSFVASSSPDNAPFATAFLIEFSYR